MLRNTLHKIKGVHCLTLPTPFAVGPVNVYLLEGKQLTLVDAGPKTEEAWESFNEQLQELGYNATDIEQVVITHHHPDHIGMLDFFGEVPVYGHWRNQPWISQDDSFIEHHDAYFIDFFRTMGIAEVITKRAPGLRAHLVYSCSRDLNGFLKEQDTVPGLPEWKVIETPGHAQSHISLYREEDSVMIAGDHILKDISSNPLLEPPYPGEKERPKPLLQHRRAKEKLLQYEISLAFTGHGEEVEDVHSLVGHRLKKQEERASLIENWINENPMNPFKICKKMFPKAYKKDLVLAMSEVIGNLDYLVLSGKVQSEQEDGVFVYRTQEGFDA